MLDFKAKTHQFRFPLGLRAKPRWGFPRPLSGPISSASNVALFRSWNSMLTGSKCV